MKFRVRYARETLALSNCTAIPTYRVQRSRNAVRHGLNGSRLSKLIHSYGRLWFFDFGLVLMD